MLPKVHEGAISSIAIGDSMIATGGSDGKVKGGFLFAAAQLLRIMWFVIW